MAYPGASSKRNVSEQPPWTSILEKQNEASMSTSSDFDNVELLIKSCLERSVSRLQEAGSGDDEWTKAIKMPLCELGRVHKYGVSATGIKADTGEWLFDMVWCDGNDGPFVFTELILAMECEWSQKPDDIWWDFEKLLIAKAKYHVFIFQQGTSAEVESFSKKFKLAIRAFKGTQPGDRFLFAAHPWDARGLRVWLEVAPLNVQDGLEQREALDALVALRKEETLPNTVVFEPGTPAS
jgi:hypothetical protein